MGHWWTPSGVFCSWATGGPPADFSAVGPMFSSQQHHFLPVVHRRPAGHAKVCPTVAAKEVFLFWATGGPPVVHRRPAGHAKFAQLWAIGGSPADFSVLGPMLAHQWPIGVIFRQLATLGQSVIPTLAPTAVCYLCEMHNNILPMATK